MWGMVLVASGVWCASLARILSEMWPRRLIWLGSPVSLLAWGLIGMAALPAYTAMRKRPVDVQRLSSCTWPLAIGGLVLVQPAIAPLWGIAALVAGIGGVWWLCGSRRHRIGGWIWDVVVFASPLALYTITLAPSVLPGDSGEFQFVIPTLGIPHPTGYPLYLVLGKLFSLLPIGSVAYRINFFSAVTAAGAAWGIYRCGRALDLGVAASVAGAALLAVSETFWGQAVIAEKYALNAFWVAMILWLGLQWRKTRSTRWLYAWAMCGGLSLAHHRTMILLAPACFILIWFTDRTILHGKSETGWRLLIVATIPLLLYLCLPWFSSLDPPYAYIHIDSVDAFLDLILARTYQSGVFRGGLAALPARLAAFGALLVRQFGPVGLVLAAGGWTMLFWKRREIAWVLLAGTAAEIGFALNYYVPNTFVYYLPAYVWLAVCAAAAVAFVPSLWSRLLKASGRAHKPVTLAWILLVAVLPLYLGITRLPGLDQRRAYAGLAFNHTFGQVALQSAAPDALIVADWLPATVLWYMQYVEKRAPEVQVVAVDSLEWQWEGYARDALAQGRPVYLARPLVQSGHDALSSAGPLVRVLDKPQVDPPAPSHVLDLDLEGGVRLLGSDLLVTEPGPEGNTRPFENGTETVIEGGSTLHVTLSWQAIQVPAGDYAVTVRLVDAAGYNWLEKQNRHPVGGTYPTSRWQPGEVVADYYALDLAPHLPSGEYQVLATMGVPFAGSGLKSSSGTDSIEVAQITIRKPLRWANAGLVVPARKALGRDLVLMGHDAPREAAKGETLSLSLLWLVRHAPASLPELVLIHRDGSEWVMPALAVNREDWQPGALIVVPYAFQVSETLDRIVVRSDSSGAQQRLPMRVVDAPPPVANFGNLIRLRSYAYEQETLRAGETVRLTLDWEAADTIAEPYKVFVHVLGQNGLPVAQQDNEPVDGTYPTSRWRRGERVSDPYTFALPADLAPGKYQVEVGLYRIADLGRLPVLDGNLAVIDDKVFLTPIQVDE
ncbi:MAG: DUF2723 domain-containing protein [Anaerolineae bacterium]|nr:DUF2723 domain-containing protein [Anaerolineae bacterium]